MIIANKVNETNRCPRGKGKVIVVCSNVFPSVESHGGSG